VYLFFASSSLGSYISPYDFQLIPGNIEKSDVVQTGFLILVAGNATMVNMINLVNLGSSKTY